MLSPQVVAPLAAGIVQQVDSMKDKNGFPSYKLEQIIYTLCTRVYVFECTECTQDTIVTTRVGNPNKQLFATVAEWGVDPKSCEFHIHFSQPKLVGQFLVYLESCIFSMGEPFEISQKKSQKVPFNEATVSG